MRHASWLTLAILVGSSGNVSAADFSWQQPHAQVLPTGDLEWAPQPLAFEIGSSVRYIDFDNGNDAGAGDGKQRPWKHHPWDPNAHGRVKQASGADTFVFKRGVSYRGILRGPAGVAGTARQPIRLTSDPSWGDGEAVICGSEQVDRWQRGGHAKMPETDKVWHADLDYAPRAAWMVGADGKVVRLKLARPPNWHESDPDDVHSEWWSWEQPRWWTGEHKMLIRGNKVHLGIDKKHLTREPEYYEGALVWSEWAIMMGAPYATRVEAFDARQKGIAFQGPWFGDSQVIATNNRYYLEDKPQYLDEPGEFWFDKQGAGGRLYVRLPGDVDPATVRVEAARHATLIDMPGMSHVHISGLTFRFGNVFWNLDYQGWQHPDVHSAAIRVLGGGENIAIRHCRFQHLSQAIRMEAVGRADSLDRIVVADNEVEYTDHGAIEIRSGQGHAQQPPAGTLGDVKVLRNRLHQIGGRAMRVNGHMALTVVFPQTAEVAGNMLHRCYGAGLFLFGGKGIGCPGDAPLSRWLVHHNKVVDPLLACNDWGGIETWQGGPFYVYNNVSGNPGGLLHWTLNQYEKKKEGTPRFGFAFYLDGSFKNYVFNNIAWGKNNEQGSKYANCAAFQEVIGYENSFFNNTIYRFVLGTRRQAPQAGRDRFLGNVFQDVSQMVFRHSDAKGEDPNARDAGKQVPQFAYETNAYAGNVLSDIGPHVGVFEARGGNYRDLESFRKAMQARRAMASDIGVMAPQPPLRDPARHDFRLAAGSAAANRGAKVFVPWALYGTVGEWNFTRNNADPTAVIDEHWYLTPYHTAREDYYKRPTYPLKAVNVTANDYVAGPLEDWTSGALRLNGKDQYLVLANEDSSRPFVYEGAGPQSGGWVTVTAPVRVAPGQKFTVELKPAAAAKGQKIAAHLHFVKTAAYGGFNAWGGQAATVQGEGPYRFTFTPEDKPDLRAFSLLVFLSPTGNFSDKTLSAHLPIEKGSPGNEMKMQTVTLGGGKETAVTQRISEPELKNPQMQTNNFLIEVYFRIRPGHGAATLVSKMADAGYALAIGARGEPVLRIAAAGQAGEVAGDVKVNDGQWHHVVAEADRRAARLAVYVDGRMAGQSPARLPADASLANTADLLVGKAPDGTLLAGEFDFLRIARGTLADAKTTIEELYAWQFDGPFLRDFCGRAPADGKRDAGAIQHVEER